MSGFIVVLLIIILAGGIAYVGDRVGHQVGRKRLTLFGLRPKYTSTIVAVGTGMAIALIVTLVALAASNYVRTAFFTMGTLTRQINQLQAQEIAQSNELKNTRNGAVGLVKYQLIANTAWTFDLSKSNADQLDDFCKFFDSVVRIANQTFTAPYYGLKPYTHKSSEPAIRAKLEAQLEVTREKNPADPRALILYIPVASQNLFRGEVISLAFAAYEDTRLATAGETLATIDVAGGTTPDFGQLTARAGQTLAARGYPPQFLYPTLLNSTQAAAVTSQLPRLRGKYRLIAKTPIDLYPHSGPIQIDVGLEAAH